MNQKTTEHLLKILKDTDSVSELNNYINEIDSASEGISSFDEYIRSLPEFGEKKASEIIRDSRIERTYGYQILNGTRKPGRDKVLMISLAMNLPLDKVQKALKSAQEAMLYSRDRRDAILIYSIEHKMSVDEACDLLDQFGEKILD